MTLLENKQKYNSEIPRQIENDLSLSGWETMCKNPDALAQVPNDTTLTIGFGVSSSLTPRILAYPLLALEMLKSNPQMQLEMYVATQFATLQGVTETQGELFGMQRQQASQGFTCEMYEDTADRVSFFPTFHLTPERMQFFEGMSSVLAADTEVMRFVNRKAQSECDIQQALAYIASHSLYMRDPLPIDQDLFMVPQPSSGSAVTMVGGPAEEIMWTARQRIMEAFGVPQINLPIQLFTTVGRMPPYYRRGNEPVFSDRDMIQGIPEAMLSDGYVFRDYAYLCTAIARAQGTNISFTTLSAKAKDREQFIQQPFVGESISLLQQFCQSV